jgi:hypothetical protein
MPVRLLVLLLVLLGAAASAQEPAPALPPPPLVTAPEEDAPPAPPPADAPVRGEREESPLHDDQDNARFVPRLSLEVLGGTAGGFVAGGSGFLLGALLGVATVGCGSYECIVAGFVGGAVGLLLGVPTGTYLGGRILRGRGTFSATMAGSLIGWGLTGLGLGILSGTQAGASDVATFALLSLPVVGASVAYEISHADHLPQAPRPSASGPRVVPVVGFTASGPRLGLAGQF